MAAIYRILNVATDAFYIGSARNPKKRRWEHWNDLKRGVHHCAALQAAWDEYGADAFEFEIIEEVSDEADLLRIEDMYLIQHAGQARCYNTAVSSMQPPSVRPETIEKIRATTLRKWAENPASHPRRGRKHTAETKAKISAAKKANPTTYWAGKQRADTTKAKISATQQGVSKGVGRKVSEAGRAKIRANIAAGRSHTHWRGRKHKDESKLKMSKRVFCVTDNRMFDSLIATLKHYGLKMPTLRRALKSGLPIQKGRLAGYVFQYGEAPNT